MDPVVAERLITVSRETVVWVVKSLSPVYIVLYQDLYVDMCEWLYFLISR